jgi:predicted aspartyl protease
VRFIIALAAILAVNAAVAPDGPYVVVRNFLISQRSGLTSSPLVWGEVNGHRVAFDLDTGATTTTLTFRDAVAVGVNYEDAQLTGIESSGGASFVYSSHAHIIVAGKDFPDHQVDTMLSSVNLKHSLLGADVINAFKSVVISHDGARFYP